jgi:hypothetical protein
VIPRRATISGVGKSLALSSNGISFDRLMKILVSTPKEKLEKIERKKRGKSQLKAKNKRQN